MAKSPVQATKSTTAAAAKAEQPKPETVANQAANELAAATQGAPSAVQEPIPVDDIDAARARAQALRGGKRIPANARVARLSAPVRPGWHRCWVNDSPGNIQRFQDIGFDFVLDPIARTQVKNTVGVAEGGGGLVAFLMEIPQEIYDEDMKALAAEMDKIDSQIHRGEVDGKREETELTIPKDSAGREKINISPLRR